MGEGEEKSLKNPPGSWCLLLSVEYQNWHNDMINWRWNNRKDEQHALFMYLFVYLRQASSLLEIYSKAQ